MVNVMNKPTRYYSNKQEKRTAKVLGGVVQSGSGCTAFAKGDVSTTKCLIECKTSVTEKKSFSIKKEVLDKIEEQAFSMKKPYPILAFNFGNNTDNYYVLNERTFRQFKDYLESLDP